MPVLNPKASVNWEEAKKFEALPEGQYAVRIDKVEERISRDKKEPYWNVTFIVTEEPFIGRKLYDRFPLSPEALWKLRQLAEACGMDCTGEVDLDSQDFLQSEVKLNVGTEEYQGETRNKIKKISAL